MNLLGNNNVIENAKNSVETSNKQTATEKMNLKLTTIQMDSYIEKQRLPTLQEVATSLDNDDEVEEVGTSSKYKKNSNTEVASLISDIDIGTSNSIYVTLNEFPYEFEINNSLQLASIDGVNLITDSDNINNSNVTITREEYESLLQDIEELKQERLSSVIETKSVAGTPINLIADNSTHNIYSYTVPEDGTLIGHLTMYTLSETSGKIIESKIINATTNEIYGWDSTKDTYNTAQFRMCNSSVTIQVKKGDVISFQSYVDTTGTYYCSYGYTLLK